MRGVELPVIGAGGVAVWAAGVPDVCVLVVEPAWADTSFGQAATIASTAAVAGIK
jgi:hypothetical protein